MKIRRALFLTALSTLMFYSCNTDDENDFANDNRTPVHFTSRVNGEIQLKASGASWTPNDRIGIFMKSPGAALSSTSIIDGADNKIYSTSGNGYFTPINDGQAIYYPQSGNVDFISYYPQQANLTDFKYQMDITDQSSQEALDLMYSNNLSGVNSSNRTALSFNRQLAKIELNITTGQGVSSLYGLTVMISGVKTQAEFNLSNATLTVSNATGSDFSPKITSTGQTAARAEAILIPDNGGTGRVISFTLPSVGTFTWEIPASLKLEKGRRYKYDVVLKDKSVIPAYSWVEMPVIESIENTTTITHMLPDRDGRNYSMLYDTKYKMAYWVAYPLHSSHLGTGRYEDWRYDPSIDESLQPNLTSGFPAPNTDRGHQIPSADRTYSAAGSRSTFYFTNMTAQHSRLNQGIWQTFEGKVRTWTLTCDTMYVVTGAMLTKPGDMNIEYVLDNSGLNVGRPKYYFKALAQKVGTTYYTAGYTFDNALPDGSDINAHRMTVKDLETLTGFTFFPAISDADKGTIVDTRWKI